MKVCEYCKAAIYWDKESALRAGRKSMDLPPSPRFRVGATGKIKGRPFTVVGRLSYAHKQGTWNEWFVEMQDGTIQWLSEDEGEIFLETPLDLTSPVPPFDKLVQAFKYSGKTKVGELLGRALAALVQQDEVLSAADAVCPVPLHPARLRERGFNQSLLLAAAISMSTRIPLRECLTRTKNTATQTRKMSSEARLKNLANAFRLRPDALINGRRVLLVDDVMTTGATVNEVARVLREAGAAGVYVVTVARG